MLVATWNLEWAGPGSARTPYLRKHLRAVGADAAVLTEVHLGTLDDWAHVADPGPHPKVRGEHRRKVTICSQHPITVVDAIGSPDLPPRNFIAVDIEVPDAPRLRLIGLVIRYNQKAEFVDALPAALAATVTDRTVVAGDFNLRIPRRGLSARVSAVLDDFGLDLLTGGEHSELARELPLIDHVAASPSLRPRLASVWGRHSPAFEDGSRQLTDHAGAAVEIEPGTASTDGSSRS